MTGSIPTMAGCALKGMIRPEAIADAIGIVTWPTIVRLLRAETRALSSKDFIVTARGMDYDHARIILAKPCCRSSLPSR